MRRMGRVELLEPAEQPECLVDLGARSVPVEYAGRGRLVRGFRQRERPDVTKEVAVTDPVVLQTAHEMADRIGA